MDTYGSSKASSISCSSRQSSNANAVSYVEIKVLGQGAYGRAILYRNTNENYLVVWKEVLFKKEKQPEIQREIDILSILDHPNVIGYYDSFFHLDMVYIEMEYANSGTLSQFIVQLTHKLPESDIKWYFFQLINGLQYVHKMLIIHRDIKPMNLFLNTNSLLKIGDFGISKKLKQDGEQAISQLGTPMYMSPELLKGQGYTTKSDIWSCGCVLYELIAQQYLFESSNQLGLAMKIINRKFQPMPKGYSTELINILESMLQMEFEERPNCSEIISSNLWTAEDVSEMTERVQQLNQRNIRSAQHSLMSNEQINREILCIDSDIFIWGGGKSIPSKLAPFTENKSGAKVCAGRNHFAVITIEGNLYTWSSQNCSSSNHDYLGHEGALYRTPRLINEFHHAKISQVSCSEENTFCLTDTGKIYGCGSNYYGQMGLGSHSKESFNIFTNIPIVNVDTGIEQSVVQITAGSYHVMAMLDNYKCLYSWGQGEYGRLGHGNEDNYCTPTLIDHQTLLNMRLDRIIAGRDCSFVILAESGRVLACGNNKHNKLGINSRVQLAQDALTYDVPLELCFSLVQPLKFQKIIDISCGDNHTCFLDELNHLWIIGSNKYGQLGLGDTKPHFGLNKCSKLLLGKSISKVSCGDKYTLVQTAENEVFGWGYIAEGRLGIENSTKDYLIHPTPLFGTLWKVADISSSYWHTIMLAEIITEANLINKNDTSSFNLSSEVPTWLKDELNEALGLNDVSSSNTTVNCECNCNKCHSKIIELQNYIIQLEEELKTYKHNKGSDIL